MSPPSRESAWVWELRSFPSLPYLLPSCMRSDMRSELTRSLARGSLESFLTVSVSDFLDLLEHPVAELRSHLGVGGDAAGIIIGSPSDQSRTEPPEKRPKARPETGSTGRCRCASVLAGPWRLLNRYIGLGSATMWHWRRLSVAPSFFDGLPSAATTQTAGRSSQWLLDAARPQRFSRSV